jgi:hypothetical protein
VRSITAPDSPFVHKLKAALDARLAATSAYEKQVAEDTIASILRGGQERARFDSRAARAGRDE